MKWYKLYPADWKAKTVRLSLLEKGAYRELLDEYYLSEEPLPADLVDLCRIANAQSPAERKAVAKVAELFFPRNGDGRRHNKRSDEEITKAKAISEQRAKAGHKGGSKRRTVGHTDIEREGNGE